MTLTMRGTWTAHRVRAVVAVAFLVPAGGCAATTPGTAQPVTAVPTPTATGAADGTVAAPTTDSAAGSPPTAASPSSSTALPTAPPPVRPTTAPGPAQAPAPAPTPAPTTATAPTTQPPAEAPSTTVAAGPRILLVVLASHPNFDACPQVGSQVELTFTWQAAGADRVAVQRPDGAYLVRGAPPASSITFTHTCSAMPSLYRFIPISADGTTGPPWNFNV